MRVKKAMVCEHHKKAMLDTCLLCKVAKLTKENKALKEEMAFMKGDHKTNPFYPFSR